jgi:putative inorganic carbon (HCO3(-)) transporter
MATVAWGIGCLVAIAIAGAVATYDPVLGLVVPVAVAALVVLMRRIEFAAVLVIACAPFDRYLNTYVSSIAFKTVGVILLVSFVFNRFGARPLKRQPVTVAIGVFLGLMLLAALVHPNGALGLQVVQRYLSFGLTAIALVSVLQRELAPKVAVATYTYACTVGSGFALFNFLSGGSLRASGPILDPNDLAYVLVAAIPFAVWLSSQRFRAFHLLCALSLACAAAATLSRGGAIAAVAMLALALWRGHIPTKAIVGTLVAIVVAAPIVAGLEAGILNTALSQKQYIAQTNIDTRALRWHAALVMTQDQPLFGEGPGGFRQNYLVVSDHAEPADPVPVSHEMYLEVSSELGIPALIAFLSIIGLAFRSAGAARALSRGSDRSLASATSISLVGICVASAFLTEQYYLTLWFVLALSGGLLGRAQAARRSNGQRSPEAALVA